MKRLFVCCDGTWNSADRRKRGVPSPTNVRKFWACISPEHQGVQQLAYYHPGVGVEPTLIKRLWGGLSGDGISRNIRSAYKWLVDHYEAGDEIYLVGYSRGAYTVRSVVGLIRRCGLPHTPPQVATGESEQREARIWSMVNEAYRLYRHDYRQDEPREKAEREESRFQFWEKYDTDNQVSVQFLGVWDTVGALGVPRDLQVLGLASWLRWLGPWFGLRVENHCFHDVRLWSHVQRAYHAIAIDEDRESYAPTLWQGPFDPSQTVEQVWFPGVHADVGGGHPEVGLSDISLNWMLERATRSGAGLRADMIGQLKPDARGPMHASSEGLMKRLYLTQPRAIPFFSRQEASVSEAAMSRHERPPVVEGGYRDARTLAVGESSGPVAIYAGERWNWTGLFLEAGGRYEFKAAGQWLDDTIAVGPEGFEPHLIHRIADWAAACGKSRFGRRAPRLKWFSLVGAIAGRSADGASEAIEYLDLGTGCTLSLQRAGYLHAFANDAWDFYFNNRGSVQLTVQRVG